MGIENPVHLLFIGVIALIVLGPKRLPELARAVGKAAREFRDSLNDGAGGPEPQDTAEVPRALESPEHRG